jgi:TPR repeat protein
MTSPPPPLNETLRKDYFETKYKEFKEGCEELNSPTACFSLGEWYQLVAKNIPIAANIYYKNCQERNDANSCYNLASLLISKRILPAEIANNNNNLDCNSLIRNLCEKACHMNYHSLACAQLAHFTLLGKGGPQNIEEGLSLLDKLCQSPINDARACVRLASAYLKPSYNLTRNPEKAFSLMQHACDHLGHPNACQILAVMYSSGDGIVKNMEKSELYKNKTLQLFQVSGEQMGNDVVKPHASSSSSNQSQQQYPAR